MATTLLFLPGKFHGQRRLAGHSPWVAKRWTQLSKHTEYFYHPKNPMLHILIHLFSLIPLNSWYPLVFLLFPWLFLFQNLIKLEL